MSIARKARPFHGFASSNPYVCSILSHGLLRSERLFAPEGDPPAGGGAGGNDPPPAKTFTQEDFDRAIGKVRSEERAKFKDYDDLKKQVGELSTLKSRLEELESEKQKAGKTADEIRAMEADKAAKQLQRERDENSQKLTVAEQRAAEAEAKLLKREQMLALGSGLDAAKVLGSARDKAIKLFLDDAKVDFDDDGKVVSVTYNGIAHKDAASAAAVFLKDNPFMAAAPGGGGGGTKLPNGGGGTGGRPLHEMSEDELLRMASAKR
jgi:ribosomal protein L22